MDLFFSLVTLVVILAAIFLWNKTKTNLQMPGIKGWPIVGSIFQIDRMRPDQTFLQWAKDLGPVYSVQVFNQTWVIITGYEEMYEMLVTKGSSFAGRSSFFRLNYLTCGNKDIINGNPTQPHWTPLRKAAHRGIRHYGSGLTRLESTLSMMANDFVDTVSSYKGKAVDLREDIYNFVLKVAVTMISGKKVTEDDDTTLGKMRMLEQLLTTTLVASSGWELDFFPWLRHFGHPAFKEVQKVANLRDQLWDEMWLESQQTYSPDGDSTCIMHSIVQLLDKESQYYDPVLDQDHARGIFMDLVMASIITTSNFSYLLPNVLLHNKHVTKRLQEETDQVIGHDRQPSIFDRDSMPYTAATIYELLRYGALVVSVPHAALETTTLGGYTIPAGTIIAQQLPGVLHDKAFWGDPENFRPERFLDDDGNLLPADHATRKHMLQFGAGPRVCIGEAFALKRLFIFLTSIIQSFDLEPGNNPLVPCDHKSYVNGGLLHQLPYFIKLTPRR